VHNKIFAGARLKDLRDSLTDPKSAMLTRSMATGTIVASDLPPTMTISDVTLAGSTVMTLPSNANAASSMLAASSLQGG
jgi:hypothetical protein